ncbi:hypothetical protein FRX31_010097 [Thalictrum thalictroides]|uniref:Uncharacterized protein n=1 Tax=Thalictrum thalictroides TaxID=46969 RepID=A0A7J6WUZ3_THATH|nr:hypothetical protein FRX31_010097 [Thalictrum thalictroides]
MSENNAGAGAAIVLVIVAIKIGIVIAVCCKRAQAKVEAGVPDSRFLTLTMDKFLFDMEREKPIRFSSEQLQIATDNFAHLLGSGGFGAVYKGLFSNGVQVAVKILNGSSDKRIEQQFMAEEWFPKWAWNKFEKGETVEFMVVCGIEDKDKEIAERMVKVALWCVQYRPDSRPWMSLVLKMLEGGVDIPTPPNPFQHLVIGTPPNMIDFTSWTESGTTASASSQMLVGSPFVNSTPVMRKYQIEIASS